MKDLQGEDEEEQKEGWSCKGRIRNSRERGEGDEKSGGEIQTEMSSLG